MKTWCAVLVAGLVVATASTSQARRYGGGGGGGGGTVQSAYLNGMGNLIRNEGMYNLETAQANIAQQQANTLYIQNRMLATKTYFEMREYNREARAAERSKPMSSDAASHYYDQLKPKKLSASQLDPVSGHVTWPLALQGEDYASYRLQLESLFKLRAQHQELNYNDVRQGSEGMATELRKHIDEFAPQDYESAHKFIEALAFEAHFPAD